MDIASVVLNPPDASNTSRDKDDGLVARARNGDVPAFEQLYRQHMSRIYATCLRIVAERGVAEECVQDAFLRAWHALGDFRGESQFGTWLTRIAINSALQRLRLEKRRLRLVQPTAEEFLENLPAPEQAPEPEMDLERLIATLPAAARAVFVLHAIEGYSHQEIAEMTDIAIGTCKAHVYRARQLLQARLQT